MTDAEFMGAPALDTAAHDAATSPTNSLPEPTQAMKEAGRTLTVYWYDADHAFANPSGGRYDQADAALAWERTLAFLRANLG